jgi:hypothetical protein
VIVSGSPLTARAGERGPLWGLLLPEKETTIDEV